MVGHTICYGETSARWTYYYNSIVISPQPYLFTWQQYTPSWLYKLTSLTWKSTRQPFYSEKYNYYSGFIYEPFKAPSIHRLYSIYQTSMSLILTQANRQPCSCFWGHWWAWGSTWPAWVSISTFGHILWLLDHCQWSNGWCWYQCYGHCKSYMLSHYNLFSEHASIWIRCRKLQQLTRNPSHCSHWQRGQRRMGQNWPPVTWDSPCLLCPYPHLYCMHILPLLLLLCCSLHHGTGIVSLNIHPHLWNHCCLPTQQMPYYTIPPCGGTAKWKSNWDYAIRQPHMLVLISWSMHTA